MNIKFSYVLDVICLIAALGWMASLIIAATTFYM
jgi:hypothetical protein